MSIVQYCDTFINQSLLCYLQCVTKLHDVKNIRFHLTQVINVPSAPEYTWHNSSQVTFIEMKLSASCSLRIRIVLPTDTDSVSSITCLSVFFHWVFCCPDQKQYFPLEGDHSLVDTKHIKCFQSSWGLLKYHYLIFQGD